MSLCFNYGKTHAAVMLTCCLQRSHAQIDSGPDPSLVPNLMMSRIHLTLLRLLYLMLKKLADMHHQHKICGTDTLSTFETQAPLHEDEEGCNWTSRGLRRQDKLSAEIQQLAAGVHEVKTCLGMYNAQQQQGVVAGHFHHIASVLWNVSGCPG